MRLQQLRGQRDENAKNSQILGVLITFKRCQSEQSRRQVTICQDSPYTLAKEIEMSCSPSLIFADNKLLWQCADKNKIYLAKKYNKQKAGNKEKRRLLFYFKLFQMYFQCNSYLLLFIIKKGDSKHGGKQEKNQRLL